MRPSPPDGIVKHNSFTKVVYRDTYPAVDPRRPQLSQHGRVILITGASKGIGLVCTVLPCAAILVSMTLLTMTRFQIGRSYCFCGRRRKSYYYHRSYGC